MAVAVNAPGTWVNFIEGTFDAFQQVFGGGAIRIIDVQGHKVAVQEKAAALPTQTLDGQGFAMDKFLGLPADMQPRDGAR